MSRRNSMKATASMFLFAVSVVLSAHSSIPLPEHPRPDWERPQWINLNGAWDFGFEKGVYDRKITALGLKSGGIHEHLTIAKKDNGMKLSPG